LPPEISEISELSEHSGLTKLTKYTTNRQMSWAIGCILLKMIIGKHLVSITSINKLYFIIKYLGSPSLTECDALNISYNSVIIQRPKCRIPKKATFIEKKILNLSLTWNPEKMLYFTSKGIIHKILPVYEDEAINDYF
jgi:hypothetical protein